MNHNQLVQEFLTDIKERDPDAYQEACEKFPTLTSDKWKTIRRKEVCVGLLGLQPSHISPHVAEEHKIESVYADTKEE